MLTIEEIRAVVADYFKDKPVKKVWLFGSYARGEAREDSDVDLLLDIDDSERRLSYFDLARFVVDLQDLFGRDVSLSQEKTLYPRVKKWVDKDRIELINTLAA